MSIAERVARLDADPVISAVTALRWARTRARLRVRRNGSLVPTPILSAAIPVSQSIRRALGLLRGIAIVAWRLCRVTADPANHKLHVDRRYRLPGFVIKISITMSHFNGSLIIHWISQDRHVFIYELISCEAYYRLSMMADSYIFLIIRRVSILFTGTGYSSCVLL